MSVVEPASRLQPPIPSCLNGLKRRLTLLVSLVTVACMGSLQVACATRPDAVQAHDAVLRAPGTTVALAEQRLPPALATSTRLPTALLVSLNRAGLPEASFSVWVQGADQATPLLSHLADQPRLMASAMKLVTTGTALRLLGPTFSWRTDMALRGALDTQGVLQGDVHIQASGDPSLDGTRLLAWLQQWREAGLKDIRGQILVDDRVFTLPPHDPSAFDGEALKPYNAGPRAWLLAHGAVSLQVQPDAAHPGWARVVLSPALLGKRVDADVSLDSQAPCGDWRSALRVDWSADAVRVQGRYAMSCGVQSWPMLWPESTPGEHSSRVLAGAWAALGGSLAGTTQRMPWPEPPPPVWLSWHSPPLAEVIRDINKFSNNVMARQLFLTLGRLRTDGSLGEVGTLAQARAIATAHVLQVTGLPSGAGNANPPCAGDALQLDNGAGLSRYEGASARCLGSWLATWWQDPLMPELLASLPIAGVDGTARRTQAAVGRAHIKTGSLDNVMAVAGMVQTPDGQRRMVVGVINHPQAEQGRAVMQTLLNWASTNAPTP